MKYRLHHETDLGEFELDELRRRRDSGVLSGREHVWREGMPDWVTLDSVLGSGPPPVPASAKRRRANSKLLVIAATCGAVIVFVVWVLGFAKGLRHGLRSALETGTEEEARQAADAPIVVPTNAMTMEDVNRQRTAFRQRQWLEGFKARGDKASPCHGEIVKFIEEWLAYNGGSAKTDAVSPNLIADKLVARTECSDPLFLALAGANSIEGFEGRQRLERALEGFPQSQHKAYPRFFATVLLADHFRDQKPRLAALDASAAALFGEAFRDGSFLGEDQGELAEIFLNGWAEAYFHRYSEAIVRAVPGGDKRFAWLQKVLAGQRHIREAWRARGGGYSDSVSEKGWRGFNAHLQQARTNLVDAWKLRPDLPQAPALMLTVAMGSSGAAEMRQWFDRALAAQIDYRPAWSTMRFGLWPRWHGSHEEMLALGIRAVDTGRFDTDVPRNLFETVSALESDLEVPKGRHIYGREDIWPHLKRMYEGYIAEPKQAATRDGWRTAYAVVAYFAGKYDVARAQMEAIQWQPWANSISGYGADLSLLPLEIAARTGGSAGEINRAETARQRFNLTDALKIYQQLATNAADERTQTFCRHRIAATEAEIEFRQGRWVPWLPADASDARWVVISGKLQAGPDGSLDVESGIEGHMLFSRARLGTNFEARGEFEVVRSSNNDFQAGLVIGLPDEEWYGFRVKRNSNEGNVAAFAQGWTSQQIYQRAPVHDRTNSFYLSMNGALVTASVNGREVFREAKPPVALRFPPDGIFVGIGAYNDMNETVIRYRKLEIRQLGAAKQASVR